LWFEVIISAYFQPMFPRRSIWIAEFHPAADISLIDSCESFREKAMKRFSASICMLVLGSLLVFACWPAYSERDPIQQGAKALKEDSGGKVTVTLEERTRWEEKYGVNFGKDRNQQEMLSRLRIGMTFQPKPWLALSAMGQDARAPFYGKPAPTSMRDSMDLHESYVVFGSAKSRLNFSAGRRMLNYGELRVIGVPQWGNVSRTYDHGRLEFSTKKMTLDGLMISPVLVCSDSFNKPDLGNRYWGTYNVFPKVWRGMSVDAYALRHSQNKIGGWTGDSSLGTNSYGARAYGPLPAQFAYSLEGIAQNGHAGKVDHRAFGWFAAISHPFKLGDLPLDTWAEYKAASGSHYGADHSATFDQVAAAYHDKFGHMDLFGWRNIKTFRTQETFIIRKVLAVNLMYSDHHLFSASDSVYNGTGSKIATSAKGTAGTHVGQELDSFLTFKVGAHTFYAGFGHFLKGEFIRNTTSGINPRYFYIAQQYTVK
jgi:hypothetical protein